MTQILGVIGGSGICKIDKLVFIKNHEIDTPWGKPSGSILECKFNDLKLFFLHRHGSNHKLSPSVINYRANIDALKQLGVTDILSLSSVGSLRNDLVPGNLVIIDQYIDLTKKRESTLTKFPGSRHEFASILANSTSTGLRVSSIYLPPQQPKWLSIVNSKRTGNVLS